ncbi:uncharacterized protein LOC114867797 [Betta splendens]|uniref:Uncharacterized protein LOC114867797 n=1 Tax=Betta splendens TaxID=158456 RepID=A0A6P7P9B2_BETSP|nr:uncharacterized protein LOC114867797 [Betta splendens]
MIKPQQHVELPVFGKPWYWQRRGSTMESARSLAHVIMEMRDEIKKLEAENRELRGDPPASAAEAGGLSPATGREENPYLNLRRNASAPVLEQRHNENATMTVRRYSISASASAVAVRETRSERPERGDSGWARLQGETQHGNGTFGTAAEGEVGKRSNRRSLQDYVHKNRAKVKTVTFLLPVDDIYTSRPVLTKHQEESEFHQLTSVTETDS